MTPVLPKSFLDRPIAHRGLHDIKNDRPENSRAAFEAAIERGYGIELDLQLSKDGHAMVFHDYDMARLTGAHGAIQMRTAEELCATQLLYGMDETIPRFGDILALVDGHVPLLVELKDQDGAMGKNIGALERSVAECAKSYRGPIAFMSFNPHSVEALATLLPNHPRGLTTCVMDKIEAPHTPPLERQRLTDISHFEQSQSSFISHDHNSLDLPRVQELKSQGVPILCWTIKSPQAEEKARKVADNVTFEGYLPT
ncbi:glycerophosphodiester phosphodiesterase family protein [Falsihalocynthiibacter sp. SS001]|uniref:glycerophosphodiester phosphodiesterase family protein n=1 Tax=Falsihalocynthiibacter sp. SS001 TaxID=3349698 RepID=UPI0036D290B9